MPAPARIRQWIVTPIARPIGDGGVSTISSAAGRKASSCRGGAPRLGKGDNGVRRFHASEPDNSNGLKKETLYRRGRRGCAKDAEEVRVSFVGGLSNAKPNESIKSDARQMGFAALNPSDRRLRVLCAILCVLCDKASSF